MSEEHEVFFVKVNKAAKKHVAEPFCMVLEIAFLMNFSICTWFSCDQEYMQQVVLGILA